MNGTSNKMESNYFDVLIIGAGVSGINSAYRVQSEVPGATYTILETREHLGGTWDFWKYPGIRSDSDLHTFGFPWRPWTDRKPIADGPDIMKYLTETAGIHGIDKHIRYKHFFQSANWSTEEQKWTVTTIVDGEERYYTGNFLILSTGYYDYKEPLPVVIPGIENFKGKVIHPQFWPEGQDYSNKRIVVIGSGATAVTLVPNLAEKAEHVTMLQRSPTYLFSIPNRKWSLSHMILPKWLASRFDRLWFLTVPFLFFRFCRAYPTVARSILRLLTTRQLPKSVPHDPHFVPKYNPWEQRLCACPDGDFFKALRRGKASVATGVIKSVTETGITLESGQELPCDMIVTATGLKIQLAGGADLRVDGASFQVSEKFMWKGMMLQDLPNAAFVIGYTNASWTLGADTTAQVIVRLLNRMKKDGATSVVPRVPHPEKMTQTPVLNLNSTYVVRAMERLPKVGNSGPWKPRENYFVDYWNSRYGSVYDGLEYVKPVTAQL
ncbi:monooxygenase flavin-binding family protein-like protein [Eremomyces bilateralis CBS 781.70]|uniref:Monooxygenase flavin-binding family protein-like protein n=1 Tax=Eremomyces bilateralis CBS 781.70 TaxID=1392243 RepID=A0A6G1G1H0_9PEZI|nr:monooxygenase flavin-binding family protein-like protein [Eremomyces bilateralis CBS 781.70]KAF1811770.1 monooxygenase flavin-binding family protein-like protein [Eremomyces bilateralis CBS 781.70]